MIRGLSLSLSHSLSHALSRSLSRSLESSSVVVALRLVARGRTVVRALVGGGQLRRHNELRIDGLYRRLIRALLLLAVRGHLRQRLDDDLLRVLRFLLAVRELVALVLGVQGMVLLQV